MVCVSAEGMVRIVHLAEERGVIVAESNLDETIHASPAVANQALYIRSDKHLWKIARP
jgi:hypothetical protein